MGKQKVECHVCGTIRAGSFKADCGFHLRAVVKPSGHMGLGPLASDLDVGIDVVILLIPCPMRPQDAGRKINMGYRYSDMWFCKSN